MAERLILLILFLANTVLSHPVNNKTCEASDNCRGGGAFYVPSLQGGRSIKVEDWMLDYDNLKKEKSWEVFDGG